MQFSQGPSKIGRAYGYVKSPADMRDIRYRDTVKKLAVVPPTLSWLQFMGPVTNQETEGCCTGEAGHYMRQFLSTKWVKPTTFVPLSPQFIYQNAVILDGEKPANDPGATIRSVMQVLQTQGACPETDEPFNPAKVGTLPSAKAYADALTYVSGVYKGLYNLSDIRQCITSGFVFNLGFTVYTSFESNATAATGIMTMPTDSEQVIGGHAVCVFGYDDNFAFPGTNLTGALLIRNSWGADWGADGNFYMPYAYLAAGYVSECWMLHLGKAWT